MSLDLILASPPEYCKNALLWGLPVAHMASHTCGRLLYRRSLPENLRCGLMLIANINPGGDCSRERVTERILQECLNRCYSGVIADFEPPCSFAGQLLPFLYSELKRRRLSFYVSEWASDYVKDCHVILSSAITGGTLHQRIGDSVHAFGRDNIVLDFEIMSHDFLLPAKGGKGRKISKNIIGELMEFHHAKPQFSTELCCNYFTYRNKQGMHFVLYDDAESVNRKTELSMKLGISKAICLYPETDVSVLNTLLRYTAVR